MAQALVTIGVPVYHGDAFLEETLSSIQGQTYPNLDVIISLDGPDSACESSPDSWPTPGSDWWFSRNVWDGSAT